MKTRMKMTRMTGDYGIFFHPAYCGLDLFAAIIAGASNLSCGEYRKGRESRLGAAQLSQGSHRRIPLTISSDRPGSSNAIKCGVAEQSPQSSILSSSNMSLLNVQWSPRKDLGLNIRLHPSISRTYISTPGGDLELLCATPVNPDISKPPLLFIHGGFGAATGYRYFLEYFSSRGYPSYAISMRGHGNSYGVSFWKMFFTSLHQMALDATAGIRYVVDKHRNEGRPDIVPVGHSAGGALLQYILSEGLHSPPDPKKTDSEAYAVGRIGLLGVIPCYGSAGVYWNWLKLDPFCLFRMYFVHLGHPRSPLSSTRLVKQAFFCDECPDERVREFETQEMAPYESMVWALATFRMFADPGKIVRAVGLTNSSGRGSTEQLRPRVLVIAGGKDVLTRPGVMAKLAGLLRDAVRSVFGSVKSDGGVQEGITDGVEFRVVQGSGHHLMGDVYWEECAEKILRFLE